MFKFTKTGIFFLSNILLFSLIQIFIHQYSIETENIEEIMETSSLKIEEMPVVQTTEKTEIWKIEIPKIFINAEISEGTTKEILNQNVGHFEMTTKQDGNVGLAAYNVNYFNDLKLLKKGDEIKYRHNEFEKIYEVEKCRIIKNTEWGFLEETEKNMITLITTIKNQPEYRRCIQATEKEEEI